MSADVTPDIVTVLPTSQVLSAVGVKLSTVHKVESAEHSVHTSSSVVVVVVIGSSCQKLLMYQQD